MQQTTSDSEHILAKLGLRAQEDIQAELIRRAATDPLAPIHVERKEAFEACKHNVNFLGATAAPTIFKYQLPPVHLAVWSLLTQKVVLPRDFSQLALGLPRGSGKTMLIKLFILYCILFTNKRFIAIIAATATHAENLMADVFKMLSEPNIRVIFGDWRLGCVQDTLSQKRFGFRGRDIVVSAVGAGGSIRGLNVDMERPDIMIFDDIQPREESSNKQLVENLETWMIGTAMKSKSPHGCLYVYIGNMYPEPWTILKKLKDNPQWISFITGGILADGTALWEELQPLEQLLKELQNDMAMGHPEIFFAEVMNDITIGVNKAFDINNIPPCPFEDTHPQGRFIIIDPATDKIGSDLITMGLFGIYDGQIVFEDIREGRFSPGETIRIGLVFALQNSCNVIAVESTNYQYTLLYWFEQICRQYEITGISFVEIVRHGVSKNNDIKEGFKRLKPNEKTSLVDQYLHSRVRTQFANQAMQWNALKRDNADGILDVHAMSAKVLQLYGPLCAIEGSVMHQEGNALTVIEHNSSF